MLKPRKVIAQEQAINPELAAERSAALKLFNPAHYGKGQSAEYIAAAKAINAKLRDADLSSLQIVEA